MAVFLRRPPLAAFLAAAICVGGCVSLPQTEALIAAAPRDLPPRIELAQVPFFRQDDFLCGPAALAMVFNAAGVPANLESVTPLVYLPGRQGSLQAEMLGATRRSGLVAYSPPPRLEDLLRELAAGTPVVVLVNFSFKVAPVWHYAVVVGYDLERGELIVRSAGRERDLWSFAFLEFFWQDSDHWSMLALPPGRVPATATEPGFAAAERAFRRASEAHPASVTALNNLAHVLAARGRYAEAEAAARRAAAQDGPLQAQARRTLEEILQRR